MKDFNSSYFYSEYKRYSLAPENLVQIKHSFVIEKLRYISNKNSIIKVEKIGESVEGRSINMLSFGTGATKILLWSQMHGNEPTATAALLAIYNYIADNFNSSFIQKLYHNLSLHSIIMLNPDGAERFQRRNIQDIDINRDANLLQSPEGKTLKKVQEKLQPHFGFNLHDIVDREMVADSNQILTIALMAPPFNKKNEDNPVRTKAKKLIVFIQSILNEYIKSNISRYKADYMHRAFGDAMQSWGVSTALIESGTHSGNDPHYVVRLNFIALFAAFHAIATDSFTEMDENIYNTIPLEGREVFDLLIKNAKIINGTGCSPFIGDIGIKVDNIIKDGKPSFEGVIQDIGDLSITTGIKIIEGENLLVTPGFFANIPSSFSKKEALHKGITTIIQQNINTPLDSKKNLNSAFSESIDALPILPNNDIIPIKNVPEYTSIPAEILKFDNLGSIKIGKQADLLVFEADNDESLNLNRLRCVIKKGKVVFNKDNT